MPTTRLKNRLYQLALPFMAPRLPRNPEIRIEGHPIDDEKGFARLLRKHHVMGAAALLEAGKNQAMLFCDAEKPPHPARRETLFRVASITKMATALGILRCAEEGRLDLDAPLVSFFPGEHFSEKAARITLRQLLCHRAGLLDPPGMERELLEKTPFPPLLEEALQWEPGAEFHYSNLGFGLLGCVLEALLNKPVSGILQEKVFTPLGMRATLDASTLDRKDIMPVIRVLPYHPGREVTVTSLGAIPLEKADPLRHYGHTAGSMYTDLPSLRNLILCLRENGQPLLREPLGQEMQREHASYGVLSPTLRYGLGLLIIEDHRLGKGRILGHQGFAYGCADGAFWEEDTGRMMLFLNGGCSEARDGRLGLCNYEMLRWSFGKELPTWSR